MSSALDLREVARVADLMRKPNSVFVFGSNLGGKHGGGAARVAHQHYGAVWSVGEGPRGRSYALPTMDADFVTLRLDEVALSVQVFLVHAAEHPELTFAVTRIGCGIAGFSDEEIAPLFRDAPANCELPEGWRTGVTA